MLMSSKQTEYGDSEITMTLHSIGLTQPVKSARDGTNLLRLA